MELVNEVAENLDRSQSIAAVFCDLTKAFNIILEKLSITIS